MENKKKFRYTKQLINMAVRDGWTQTAIAKACRTQQSVVSGWASGEKQAREDQLQKLLEIYGPRLRRKVFHVYHSFVQGDHDVDQVHMIKVEGEVILTFPFRYIDLCLSCRNESKKCNCRPRRQKRVSTRKFIVHALGKGKFVLLAQIRLLKDQYQLEFPETNIFDTLTVSGDLSLENLLAFFDNPVLQKNENYPLHEAEQLMLRMLIRKALLEHGYPLVGIEEHSAAW